MYSFCPFSLALFGRWGIQQTQLLGHCQWQYLKLWHCREWLIGAGSGLLLLKTVLGCDCIKDTLWHSTT